MRPEACIFSSSKYLLIGTTLDIDIPFTYNLPNSTAGLVYSGRKLGEDHAAVFEIAEDLLNK